VLSDGVLKKLARMERKAAALEPESQTVVIQAEPQTERDIPIGMAYRFKPGARWNQLRQALDSLVLVGMAIVVVQTTIFSALAVAALERLGRDGLSVFIPFAYGGKQFTDLELVQIGVAMAAVAGAGVIVISSAWRHAEELLLLTFAGMAAGTMGAIVAVSAGRVTADVFYRAALGLLAIATMAWAVVLVIRAVVPSSSCERIASSLAALALTGCAILLGWSIAEGLPDAATLTIPMDMPVIAPQLIGAAVCAALGLQAYLFFLRQIVVSFGDEPTRNVFRGYLIYHAAASVVACLFLCLTNPGVVTGWFSGSLGLVAAVSLAVDYTLFVHVLRFTRATI
jgi:hypothetical protein